MEDTMTKSSLEEVRKTYTTVDAITTVGIQQAAFKIATEEPSNTGVLEMILKDAVSCGHISVADLMAETIGRDLQASELNNLAEHHFSVGRNKTVEALVARIDDSNQQLIGDWLEKLLAKYQKNKDESSCARITALMNQRCCVR